MNIFDKLVFLRSCSKVTHQCPDSNFEVAFVGYSNSGKSSAINALANYKNKLARVSKTPGCTQSFNIFQTSLNYRIVDLPGYGYSVASKKLKTYWKKIIFKYLNHRNCLIGIIIFMDIRNPFKIIDKQILRIAMSKRMKVLILLSKSDKLNYNKRERQFLLTCKEVKSFSKNIEISLFSSLDKTGVNFMRKTLINWYNNLIVDRI